MNKDATKFREGILYSLGFVMVLWLVKSLEEAMSMEFGFLGILPRTLIGTLGIITGPLVHGDFMHLLSNSFPLIMLGIGIIYFYYKIAKEVFICIYLLTGLWVWIVARDAYHIGASGIVYGMVFFLLFSGLFRKDVRSIAISLIVIFLYSGMLAGMLPTSSAISWESHLLGGFAGIFCAFYYRNFPLNDALEIQEEIPVTAESPSLMYDIVNFTNSSNQATRFSYQYTIPDKETPAELKVAEKYILSYGNENRGKDEVFTEK